jgi:hypothetical protein
MHTDFYAPGFNPRFPKVGLPAGTHFASRDDPLISFALQPASRNNVLLLRAGTAQSARGALALARPARFSHLAFLVAGFNGPRTGTYRLDFADGHSSTGEFIAPDNFSYTLPQVALGGFDRIWRQDAQFGLKTGAQFDNRQPDAPNLFDIPITLSTADAGRTLVRIEFINQDHGASGNNRAILGIFGVSGNAMPDGLRSPGKSTRAARHASLSTGADDTTHVWDARTGRLLRTIKGHKGDASVTFSPDGRRIVTAGQDKTSKVWDARTGRELRTLQGHRKSVTHFLPTARAALPHERQGRH